MCSAHMLPWSKGGGGWGAKGKGSGGWGGVGKEMGGEGRESKVCGPFLVVLSVTLWHNAAHDTRSSRAGGAAGSARAWGVEHAQVEGQALRLVLGSNRSFFHSLLLVVLLFALLLYSLVVCSPAECSTPQSRSPRCTHADRDNRTYTGCKCGRVVERLGPAQRIARVHAGGLVRVEAVRWRHRAMGWPTCLPLPAFLTALALPPDPRGSWRGSWFPQPLGWLARACASRLWYGV
jgi:hypothetical protein